MLCQQCKEKETKIKTTKYCSRECYRKSLIGHKNRNTGKTWFKKGVYQGRGFKKGHNSWNKGLVGVLGKEKSCHWKGDKLNTYHGIHARIQNILGQWDYCEICECTNKKHYEWSNKDHKYSLDHKDWQRVCKSCHMKYDYKYNGRRNQWMIKKLV